MIFWLPQEHHLPENKPESYSFQRSRALLTCAKFGSYASDMHSCILRVDHFNWGQMTNPNGDLNNPTAERPTWRSEWDDSLHTGRKSAMKPCPSLGLDEKLVYY
jgi:hypothetical protein